MDKSQGNIEFFIRKTDFFLIMLILIIISILSYWSSLTPSFMHDGKPSGNQNVGRMFAVLTAIPIPFILWVLIKPKKLILSLTPHGIVDTRLYNQTIPWHEIKKIRVFNNKWHDKAPSCIYIEVSKNFVVNTLNDKVKISFAAYTNDGLVVLTIMHPHFFQSTQDLYETISTFWVKYSKPPK